MVLLRFIDRLREYGFWRIVSDKDMYYTVLIWLSITFLELVSCNLSQSPLCISFISKSFIETGTSFSISLTAMIIAGLSVLVAFTDSKFLAELDDIGVYKNIMFVFEYTLYLTILASVLGMIATSYGVSIISFYSFLFVFIYMLFAIISLVQLIVGFGVKKAKYESIQSN